MTAAAMIECPSCDQPNRANRGYCRGCGGLLALVCRGCRFINDDGDHYCGGCGNMLATPGYAQQPAVGRASAVAERVPADELAELFVASAAPAQAELPQNITQGDLDRLFGSPAP